MYTGIHTSFCHSVSTSVFNGVRKDGNKRGTGINDCATDTAKSLTGIHAQLRNVESIIDANLREWALMSSPQNPLQQSRDEDGGKDVDENSSMTAVTEGEEYLPMEISKMPEISSMCQRIKSHHTLASQQRLEQLESLRKELIAIEIETKNEDEIAQRRHEERIKILMNS